MATIRDIAKIAGTSPATVSKALRGGMDLNHETSERIRKLAEDMGYNTENLRKPAGNAKTIGVIFMELSSEYYGSIFESFKDYMESNGYRLIVMQADFSSVEKQEKYISYLISCRVSGILFLTENFFNPDRIKGMIKKSGISFVMITQMNNIDFCDIINVNHDLGVRMAVEYLYELNHRKIAFIGDANTKGRENMFFRLIAELGLEIPDSYIQVSKNRYCAGGYEAMKRILALPAAKRPTACFAAYDNLAYGALKALREKGIKVPDDFSIIGVDNNEMSQYITPSLSSIQMPVDEVGEKSAEMLLSRINGDTSPYQTIYFSPVILKRETTAKFGKL